MSGPVRCDVCGVVVVSEGNGKTPVCSTCDVKAATAIMKLLIEGRRPPDAWRKKKGRAETP